MEIAQLLRDQKQELEEGIKNKKIIKRDAEDNFKNILNSKLIKIISGVRRCGKSTFAHMLLRDKNFAYLNFDDDRLIGLDTSKILPSFYEVYGKSFDFIFLDEVQNLENWELFVNRLHRTGFKLFITGSNSKLLSKELATHLTGRHITIELFPFSFHEYLNGIDFKEDIKTTRGESLLKHELKKYLDIGGFPDVIIEKEDPKIYIRELYTKIIDRDIISRYNISHKKTFKEIAMTLISSPARSISYNRMKNQFKIGSEHTIKNYLLHLEEAYLIFMLNRFSYKPVEIEKSEKKVYVIDPSVINSMSIKFTKDSGHIYENTVAIELLRRKSSNKNLNLYYWKNQQHEEVDFVLKEGLKVVQLIQVCQNISDSKTKEREIKALTKAGKELKCKNLTIITENCESTEKISLHSEDYTLKFIPLSKWLLNPKFP